MAFWKSWETWEKMVFVSSLEQVSMKSSQLTFLSIDSRLFYGDSPIHNSEEAQKHLLMAMAQTRSVSSLLAVS